MLVWDNCPVRGSTYFQVSTILRFGRIWRSHSLGKQSHIMTLPPPCLTVSNHHCSQTAQSLSSPFIKLSSKRHFKKFLEILGMRFPQLWPWTKWKCLVHAGKRHKLWFKMLSVGESKPFMHNQKGLKPESTATLELNLILNSFSKQALTFPYRQ